MNIKKLLEFALILMIFVFGYQFIVIYLEDSHEVSYEIASGDHEFQIDENYIKKDKFDNYVIQITDDSGHHFVYQINNTFNKQKRIIKDIKTYEKDNYLCLYPITIDAHNETEILCNDGKELVSYQVAKNKIDLRSFVKSINLDDRFMDAKNNPLKTGNITIYSNNLYDDEYLGLYRYKYMTIYNRGQANDFSFSTKDIYKNELGVYINNYFLVPVVSNTTNEYYILDMKRGEPKYMSFSDPLSKNLYNIGVIDGKLYVFDLDKKIEYAINPNNASYEIIGSVSNGFVAYENGEWVTKSITEFTKNKIKFNQNVVDEELSFDYDEIYESNASYYLVDGNRVYRVYKNYKDVRVLLFETDKFNNMMVYNDRIYYLKDDNLYRYDQYGIKTLANNNEFKYNNVNVYYVYND